jgi:hypothetical protein
MKQVWNKVKNYCDLIAFILPSIKAHVIFPINALTSRRNVGVVKRRRCVDVDVVKRRRCAQIVSLSIWILMQLPCSHRYYGASVAKWLAHLSFTSEAAGSNLTKYFLNATRTQSSCEKSKSQRSAESRGFSPGTPVSSHRESWQGGLGKKGPQ